MRRLTAVMTRNVAGSSSTADPEKPALRSRLLLRLSGLLLILVLLCVLVLTGQLESVATGNRVLLSAILFIAGAWLVFSILSLVQHDLLDPLNHIRIWARNRREGHYTDPIPTPLYTACTELADDLSQLESRLKSSGKHESEATAAGNLESESLQ
ncbi:MAG: hypothetical protein U9P11_03465, partial [Pseudomonadota bacterium]|nr:hypothetical protein [Pseudomonadota bacterium]